MTFHLEKNKQMSNRLHFRFWLTILALLVFLPLRAQNLPEPMVPLRLVNDFTGFLPENQQIELNRKLQDFNDQTSTQIYVVTYNDLQGYTIEDFGVELGRKWGIGQKGKNNGILILISPENHQHGITIQTGYGLEGAVPDAIAKRLIDQVIVPQFKQGNYYAGLDSATNVLMSLTKGEFTADNYLKKGSGGGGFPIPFVVIIFILFFIFSRIFGNRGRTLGRRSSLPWWLLLGALNSGSRSNSGWGSFTSGGGSFGGGGGGFGGGFGGGGGGSFGGGGASGGW
jgi:uncharacterized protein